MTHIRCPHCGSQVSTRLVRRGRSYSSRVGFASLDVLESVIALGTCGVAELIEHTGKSHRAITGCLGRLRRIGLIKTQRSRFLDIEPTVDGKIRLGLEVSRGRAPGVPGRIR